MSLILLLHKVGGTLNSEHQIKSTGYKNTNVQEELLNYEYILNFFCILNYSGSFVVFLSVCKLHSL